MIRKENNNNNNNNNTTSYLSTSKYYQLVFWNSKRYGESKRIKKSYIKAFLLFICLVTPFTNWIYPLVQHKIKDVIIRYEVR